MATFKVNGITASETQGSAIVTTSSKSFTLAWSNLDETANHRISFDIYLDTMVELTIGAGSNASIYFYVMGDPSDWQTYEFVSATGEYPIVAASSLSGSTLVINYTVDDYSMGTYYVTFRAPDPSFTTAPSISEVSPASGLSTTVRWTAAVAQDLGSATIKYQYFVGPSSTFNTSYLLGTTTGQTANITEANILAKCGSTFSGTCYIYVRAYWDSGTTTGGHTTPSRSTFTYAPHDTIKYYVDGEGWVECLVYYYDPDDGWVECTPYYYDGTTGWVPCSF